MEIRSNTTKSLNPNVAPDTGIIKNVDIISRRLTDDWRYYDEQFKKDIVTQGNNNELGIKSKLGHPEYENSKPTHFIGRYKNFQYFEPTDDKDGYVLADLHLDDITKKTTIEGQGISTYDYIIELSTNNPDVFGNSILYIPSGTEMVTREGTNINDLTDEEYYDLDWWNDVFYKHSLQEFIGSDLVDVPAATIGLFKNSIDNRIKDLTIEQAVKDKEIIKYRPELIKLKNHIDNMKKNTGGNSKSKQSPKKSLITTLMEKIKKSPEKLNIDLTLADGTGITIVTDNDDIAVGDVVLLEDNTTAPEGEHTLSDGRVITTDADGIITEIVDNNDVSDDSGDTEEESNTGDNTENSISQDVETLTAIIETLTAQVKTLSQNVEAQNSKINKLNKQLTSQSPKVFSTQKSPPSRDDNTADYWAQEVEKLKASLNNKPEKQV